LTTNPTQDTALDCEFLRRCLWATGWVSVLAALMLLTAGRLDLAGRYAATALFAWINWTFLAQAILGLLQRRPLSLLVAVVIKIVNFGWFFGLYTWSVGVEPISFLAGLNTFLAVVILKALGRYWIAGAGANTKQAPGVEKASEPARRSMPPDARRTGASLIALAFLWVGAAPLAGASAAAPASHVPAAPPPTTLAPPSSAHGDAQAPQAEDHKAPASERDASAAGTHEIAGAGAHAGADASAGHKEEEGAPEVPNFMVLLYDEAAEKEHERAAAGDASPPGWYFSALKALHKGRLKEPLPVVGTLPWENHIFVLIAAAILLIGFRLLMRGMDVRNPTRAQALLETIVGGANRFIASILGEEMGRRFAPYIVTLFFFILLNNIMVIFPFMKSSTSSLVLTGSLALLTFVIVQSTALIKLGPFGYLYHLAGEPKGAIMWALAPLFLVLHIIGEIAKPISLSLRLFGNVLGEDVLLGVFLMLGMAVAATIGIHPPLPGFPLHFLVYPLVFLGSAIQALVFSLLTTIYILLVLPHEHEHEEEEEPLPAK